MPEKSVSEAYAKVLRTNLANDLGWSDEKIEEGIKVIGPCVLSAARFARIFGERYKDTSAQLLEDILTKSTSIKQAIALYNGYCVRGAFIGDNIISTLRGMIFALDGNHAVDSPLDKLPDKAAPRPQTSADYYFRP